DALHSQEAAFLAKDLNTVCDMADELLGKPITDDGELIGMLVRNLVLPFGKANQLAKYGQQYWQPAYYLCTRKDAPPEALDDWAVAGDWRWIKPIVENQNTKLETIEKLSRSQEPRIVSEAITCRRLPQETIDRFANREEPEIRHGVAIATQNPSILRALAKNADNQLSFFICLNPHTPTEVINEIGRIHLEAVHSIAYRVTDPEVIRSLCDRYGKKYEVYLTYKPMPADAELKKRWKLVVNGHCWGLNEPESLAAAAEVKDREQILRMADDLSSLRVDIDKYPTLGTQILEYLIGNEALPIEVARHILRLTADRECRDKLIERSDLTLELLDEFEPCLEQLVGLAYATNNFVILERLALEPEADVRLGVVLNPKTKMRTLENMAETDIDLYVAAMATKRLTSPEVLEKVANRKDFSDNEALVLAVKGNNCASEGVRGSAAMIHAANSKYY
ncbi:MAG: hypothetical protein WCS94_18375, partial [Verrucomicrobiota bacterium]